MEAEPTDVEDSVDVELTVDTAEVVLAGPLPPLVVDTVALKVDVDATTVPFEEEDDVSELDVVVDAPLFVLVAKDETRDEVESETLVTAELMPPFPEVDELVLVVAIVLTLAFEVAIVVLVLVETIEVLINRLAI